MTDLHGRSVLITGGNGGIGLAIGRAVGAAGATVVIWGRNTEKNTAALEQLRADGITAWALQVDVTDEQAVDDGFAESVDLTGGRIDSVFANAGRLGSRTRFVDTTLEQWREVMATNLDGVFLTLRGSGAAHAGNRRRRTGRRLVDERDPRGGEQRGLRRLEDRAPRSRACPRRSRWHGTRSA